MPCPTCSRPDAQRVTLIDGREVCTWCEAWLHECEARAILAMPTLKQRRAYLYGKLDSFDKMKGGIQQLRGAAEVKRMEATMLALWQRGQVAAKNNNQGE